MTTPPYYPIRNPRADNTAPAIDCAAITPSDTVNISGGPCRGIYVGTTGNITLVSPSGNVVLFSNLPVGILPVQALRVNATATTASNLVALF